MADYSKIYMLLAGLSRKHDLYMHKLGCYGTRNDPPPSLQKGILPMFVDRWATSGPNQHTNEISHARQPALQLATRFPTEDYPLLWFSRLTFGEPHRRPSPPGIYLAVSPTVSFGSPTALAQVRANLKELGEVLTLLQAPHSFKEPVHGMSYSDRAWLPFNSEFSDQDWSKFADKYHPSMYRRARPVIVLAAGFQDYFRYSHAKASITADCREQLTFAITLVHEVAHTYSYWLGLPKGVAWSMMEKKAELGNSWEYNVIGRAIQTLRHANAASHVLFDVKIEQYETKDRRDRVASSLVSNRIAEYTKVEMKKGDEWPVLTPSENQFISSEFYLDQTCDHYIAVLNAIPMK